MTDLGEDVRIVAEFIGWDWCDGTQFIPKPRPLATNDDGYRVYVDTLGPDGDIFTASILDKLEAEGIGYGFHFTPLDAGAPHEFTIYKPSGKGRRRRAITRAEAIVRATAAWRRAEGGDE